MGGFIDLNAVLFLEVLGVVEAVVLDTEVLVGCELGILLVLLLCLILHMDRLFLGKEDGQSHELLPLVVRLVGNGHGGVILLLSRSTVGMLLRLRRVSAVVVVVLGELSHLCVRR